MVEQGLPIEWLNGPLAAAKNNRLLDRLDDETKVKVLSALAGLVILGFALMLLAWLGARATKRYMNSGSNQPRSPVDPDDWALKNSAEHDDE